MLFPVFCFGCEKEGAVLCEDCAGKVLFPGIFLDSHVAMMKYDEDHLVGRLLHAYKYEYLEEAGVVLAHMVRQFVYMHQHAFSCDSILAVPLHKKRFCERGFNQSDIFARAVSDVLGVPVICALRRSRNTKQQASLDRDARLENVHDAFEADASVCEKHVLLVDDVYTTGATMRACMDALQKKKVATVSLFTVAT